MFSDEAFTAVRNRILPKTETTHFFDCLETCRSLIKRKEAASNILRYLLQHMTNRVIKNQYKEHWKRNYQDSGWEYVGGNFMLSNLYLAYECILQKSNGILNAIQINKGCQFKSCELTPFVIMLL